MWKLPIVVAVLFLAGCSGSADSDVEDVPVAGDDAFEDLEVTETTGLIRGVVVDLAIRPVSSADVTLSVPSEGTRSMTTLGDGSFGFDDLPEGTYFLRVEKPGYNSTQVTTDVVAGVLEPPIVKVLLEENPAQQPYFQDYSYEGFSTCGAAIGLTSVGCTTFPDVAEQLGDSYIWNILPDTLPMWIQGELVWDQTQPAGGMLIWEIVPDDGTSGTRAGYRETTTSPALAYWNTTTILLWEDVTLSNGVNFRVFGGPHPLLAPGETLPPREDCPSIPVIGFNPCSFGFGVTLNQDFTAYMHFFYNWVPDEGWRFTVDGEPVPPS